MTRLLLLETGEAVPRVQRERGGFATLFREGLAAIRAVGQGAGAEPVTRVELATWDVQRCAARDPLPDLAAYDGFLMTGSPAMVGEDLPWMRYGVRLIEALLADERPFLGVCFGHQLLGVATGSTVGPNPQGREMGRVEVRLEAVQPDDVLFAGLPASFAAHVSHVDVIQRPAAGLHVVGQAPHDPCHIVRAGKRAWGVQFHPEFDAEVTRWYLEARADVLDRERGEGSARRRASSLAPTPVATSVLRRFAACCVPTPPAKQKGSAHVP